MLAGRIIDKAKIPDDKHGCPACPHTAEGPGSSASPDVFANDERVLRVTDKGVHNACCGGNKWVAAEGAPAVFVNDIPWHRKADSVDHCGGRGELIEGSPDVDVGDAVDGGGEQGTFARTQAEDTPVS